MPAVIQVSAVNYPESDGKPMGETDEHRDEMVRQIELLKHYYQGQGVYVSGNLLVYYEQGNPKRFVVPDLFVAKDVSPDRRRIFKIWVERKVPDVVIETTSRKTRKKDTQDKPRLYAQLGIKEFFLFDCLNEYLDPPLQGHRLVEGVYQSLPAGESGALVSEELGLRLQPDAGQLQFYRLDSGARLLTATERAEQEARVRRELEAEVQRLRAELKGRSDS
jgi:Uma2 family endonuclease